MYLLSYRHVDLCLTWTRTWKLFDSSPKNLDFDHYKSLHRFRIKDMDVFSLYRWSCHRFKSEQRKWWHRFNRLNFSIVAATALDRGASTSSLLSIFPHFHISGSFPLATFCSAAKNGNIKISHFRLCCAIFSNFSFHFILIQIYLLFPS